MEWQCWWSGETATGEAWRPDRGQHPPLPENIAHELLHCHSLGHNKGLPIYAFEIIELQYRSLWIEDAFVMLTHWKTACACARNMSCCKCPCKGACLQAIVFGMCCVTLYCQALWRD